MIERKDTPSKTAAEVELLGEERRRQAAGNASSATASPATSPPGRSSFAASSTTPRPASLGPAQKAVADHIDDIYERIDQFSANIIGKDVLAVLHADNLDGIHGDLREDGIGLTHTTPQGEQVTTDRDPLLAVLTEINDRAAYGNEATGKHLESEFAAPPYGAPVEVIQAILAAGIRSGLIDVVHQGSRIRGSADQRLDRVFGALPQFRAASFVPPLGDEVDLETRVEVAERLGELLGTHPPVATDQLAALVRTTFASDLHITGRVSAGLRGAGLPIPEPATRTASILDRIENGTDAEVVTTAAQSWLDLSSGRDLLRALDTVLQQDLDTLRDAQQQVRAGDDGLKADLASERRELADLLDGDDLPGHIARIRSIAERIRVQRAGAAEAVAAALRQKVEELRQRLRDRYSEVDETVLEEALRPLVDLVPGPEISPADYGQLAANLEAADGRATKTARQLDEILAQGKVAHIIVNDLVSRPITTEGELDGALERIREAAAAELANGKQVRLA